MRNRTLLLTAVTASLAVQDAAANAGKYQDGANAFQKATALKPNFPEAREYYGEAFLQVGDGFDEASPREDPCAGHLARRADLAGLRLGGETLARSTEEHRPEDVGSFQ